MMRKSVLTLVMALALAAPAAAQDARQPERSVTTTGQASVKIVPDRAWVNVGIEVRAQRPADVQRQAALVMQAIQKELKALGIPEDAIRTISFSLNADWDYSNNRRTLRGYVLSNMVEVKVDDLTKVGEVLDKSIAAGGNQIHGVRWDLQDRDRAERDALRQAVEDAKQRAEVAVAAAGAKLGAVLRINEQRYDSPRPMYDVAMMRSSAPAPPPAPATPVSPGEIEVRASVVVSFGIV